MLNISLQQQGTGMVYAGCCQCNGAQKGQAGASLQLITEIQMLCNTWPQAQK